MHKGKKAKNTVTFSVFTKMLSTKNITSKQTRGNARLLAIKDTQNKTSQYIPLIAFSMTDLGEGTVEFSAGESAWKRVLSQIPLGCL